MAKLEVEVTNLAAKAGKGISHLTHGLATPAVFPYVLLLIFYSLYDAFSFYI